MIAQLDSTPTCHEGEPDFVRRATLVATPRRRALRGPAHAEALFDRLRAVPPATWPGTLHGARERMRITADDRPPLLE